jgi:hypothetical protein
LRKRQGQYHHGSFERLSCTSCSSRRGASCRSAQAVPRRTAPVQKHPPNPAIRIAEVPLAAFVPS